MAESSLLAAAWYGLFRYLCCYSAGGTVFAVGEFDTQTVVKIYKWDGGLDVAILSISRTLIDGNSGVIKLSSDGSILAVGVQYPMAYELARVYAWDGISWSQRGNISGKLATIPQHLSLLMPMDR